jgi:hypothetical protein
VDRAPKNKADTPIEKLDFGDADDAVAELGCKTIGDLARLREYQLLDALDATANLDSAETFAAVGWVKEILWQHGLDFQKGSRFSSFEEMAQWALAAAAELGLRAVEEKDHQGRPVVSVQVPPHGMFSIGNLYQDPSKFDESGVYVSGETEQDMPLLQRRCRQLLARAQALQADA